MSRDYSKVEQYYLLKLPHRKYDLETDKLQYIEEDLDYYDEQKLWPFEEIEDVLNECYWQSDSAAMGTEIVGLLSIEKDKNGNIIRKIKQIKKEEEEIFG